MAMEAGSPVSTATRPGPGTRRCAAAASRAMGGAGRSQPPPLLGPGCGAGYLHIYTVIHADI